MITKSPRAFLTTTAPRFIKYGLAFELACCGISYFGWRKLNTDQDSRLYMYKNYYPILHGFYSVGEFLDKTYKQRDVDFETWTAEQKI